MLFKNVQKLKDELKAQIETMKVWLNRFVFRNPCLLLK